MNGTGAWEYNVEGYGQQDNAGTRAGGYISPNNNGGAGVVKILRSLSLPLDDKIKGAPSPPFLTLL
ncbi:MAG: hypothetical protein WAO23_05525 [Dethiobacteria bacterium]